MNLEKIRREYIKDGLTEESLLADPFEQFNLWFDQAIRSEIVDSNAMTLATATVDGKPSARTVLLKFFDYRGFVFYTNYESRKSRELKENPHAALLFYWHDLERQVRIEGITERVSTAESLKYFLSRPRGSQLGAWCSNQSSIISSRELLMTKFNEIKQRFHNKEISLPEFWGGFRIIPESFEFWQGRENRLHDRFHYVKEKEDWAINRLAP